MRTTLTVFSCLLLALGGCSTPDPHNQTTPVNVLTASPDKAQLREVMPVKQVLRPQDVLDVIFRLDTTSSGPYAIQPGDQLELNFYSASQLSGTRLVMPDGTVDLPYVAPLKVAGLSVAQAQRLIASHYEKVLKNSAKDVFLSVSKPLAQTDNLRNTLIHPVTGLSREITVGSDGRASFPLLGSMSLQGMTVDELQNSLNQRYAKEANKVRSMVQVDVMLKSTAANEVFVLGEVGQPGAYPIRRPVSVLEALALAHGSTGSARLDSVVVMHRHGDNVEARVYDVKKAAQGDALQFAYLQPDDLLYVPKSKLVEAGQLSRQLADVILFQGIGFGFSYRVDNKNNNN